LRVLLVESHADDARTIERELEQGGYDVTSRRVETNAAMRAALEESDWDLIITDYLLPEFSGPAALGLVQERELDVPFIVVSSGVGEETAVEMMRAGAHDFVTKDHLRRLVPAVQREQREAEVRRQQRRADQALRESEERYRILVESSPEPIAVHSGGVLVYANPAAARLMRAPRPSALIGMPVLDFVHPDDRPLVIERIRRTQGEGRMAEAVEERFVRLDGSVIFVETTALPTRFEGRPATQVVVRDITARKRAELTLRFLAQASARLSASLEYRETLRTVAQLAVPELGDWCLVDLVEPEGSFERVAVGCADPSQADLARSAERHYPPPQSGPQLGVGRVARSTQTEVINDVSDDTLRGMARDAEHSRLLEAMAFRSYLCAPLIARDRLLGTLTLTASQPHRYDPDTVALAEELARRSALALDNARLFEQAQAEIAERSRAEAELRASRDQLEAILGGMADGAVVQDAAARFVYANDAAARLAGFDSAAEYINAMAADVSARLEVVDAEGRPFDYEQLPARRALRGEEPAEMVVQFRRRDTGETRWSLTRSRAVTGADGQPLVISIFHDLTERIGAERRLRFLAEAGARLGTSLDEAETLAAITDLAVDTLSDWAAVYLPEDGGKAVRPTAIAHRDPERVAIARELEARYPPRPGPYSTLWRVLREGTPALVREVPDATLVQIAEDAEHLALLRALQLSSLLYVPLQARGRTLGVLALFTTAASRRRLGSDDLALVDQIGSRAALAVDNARLYAQAREAIRARDEFLSLASHELRNPVAALSGAAQLLNRARLRGQLDAARIDRYVGSIERTAAHLVGLTEDLLDVGLLQQGRLPLRFREVDLADLVRGVIARQQTRGDVQRFRFELACEPCAIVADAHRLEQVLTNLLDNAAKYSLRGEPIDVELVDDGPGVLLTVRDQGIGLPSGTEEHIFEPFGRAPNATERNIPGLGLGLYICRQIAERHGGRLWAESAGEDQGASLRLWLPRRLPAEQPSPVNE
jgi:PAS domain S-box-containing protein